MYRTAFARPSQFCSLAFGLAFVAAGCGGDHLDRNEGLAVYGDPIEIVRDETRTATVATHLVPGEAASVATFSTADLPDGVTGVFDPTTLDFGVTPAENIHLNLTASRTAQTGVFTAMVRRTKGGGSDFYTDNFKVKIIDFAVTVSADDSSVSLAPGDSHDTKITLTRRGNSNGTVEFDLGGSLPDGVSYKFDPVRLVVDSTHTKVHTTLTLTADSNASTSGSEKCHVRALKGTNVDNSDDIDVTLNVPEPPPESSAVKANGKK